jgi:phospholipid/cholesterol/gamma-HCH transport system permease protein
VSDRSPDASPKAELKASPKADVRVDASAEGTRVVVEGVLVASTIGAARASLEKAIPAKGGGAITLDLAKCGEIDASGVSMAVFLFRLAKARAGEFHVTGVEGDRKLLVDLALRGQEPVPAPAPIGLVREFGHAAIAIRDGVVDLVRFIGELSIVLATVLLHPRLLRLRDTIAAMSRHGTDAVPVVSLLGLLIGTIIAFQTFDPMAKYGAKLQVADVVSISVVRELGPLITAIILAGRSGSAFAAEIGTMKVTQELDALRTFGIDPVRFLVVPRILAVVLVTPLLSVFATLLGVAGGFLILGPEGFTFAQYYDEVRAALTVGGFLQGLAKAAVFALLVGAIGCLAGLRTGQGPGAVGLSTTRAVVAGIVAIVVADAILGSFFYALGI